MTDRSDRENSAYAAKILRANGAPMDGGEQPRIVPRVRDLREAVERIEQLTAALQHIATAEPAAAGSAKPMSFKEWARLIASTAVTAGKPGAES